MDYTPIFTGKSSSSLLYDFSKISTLLEIRMGEECIVGRGVRTLILLGE